MSVRWLFVCSVYMCGIYGVSLLVVGSVVVVFKQKTADEMRISDWSSDVCSSDLAESVLAFAEDGALVGVATLAADARRETAEVAVSVHRDWKAQDRKSVV